MLIIDFLSCLDLKIEPTLGFKIHLKLLFGLVVQIVIVNRTGFEFRRNVIFE